MKNRLKYLFLLTITLVTATSCVNDDDFEIPSIRNPFFSEDFQTATTNTDLDFTDWTNFAEQGTWKWREKTYSGNGYAEFSAFGSGSAVNEVWLVTPAIDIAGKSNPVLKFKVAQHHLDVDSPDNSLEVFVSTDYDGTNVLAATWTVLNADIPTSSVSWYEFVQSTINLTPYNGEIHIAFKFKGSGTNTTLDGAFQVDDVLLFNEN
jgi:hypothetical protein